MKYETQTPSDLARRCEREAELETVCAWCPAHLSGPVGSDAAHTSHGICPQCLEREFPEMGAEAVERAHKAQPGR